MFLQAFGDKMNKNDLIPIESYHCGTQIYIDIPIQQYYYMWDKKLIGPYNSKRLLLYSVFCRINDKFGINKSFDKWLFKRGILNESDII